jgi:hypothetical protein
MKKGKCFQHIDKVFEALAKSLEMARISRSLSAAVMLETECREWDHGSNVLQNSNHTQQCHGVPNSSYLAAFLELLYELDK